MARGFLRRPLPVRIGAQRKHGGQGIAMGEKVGLLPGHAKQIQRYDSAGGDQPREQGARLLDGGQGRRGLRLAQAGFDERGRGRGQLRMPGKIEAQGMLADPALCVFKSEDGTLVLAPVRRPCCLELLCYQETSFSRGISPAWFTSIPKLSTECRRDRARGYTIPCSGKRQERGTPLICCLRTLTHWGPSKFWSENQTTSGATRIRSCEMLAGCLSKHTAGRWGAHEDSWSGARFGPVLKAATPCARGQGACLL